MPPSPSKTKISKFTRGEKCLFVHLIITFSIILVMILTYFVHLCVVNHTRNDVFKIYRRSYDPSVSGLSLSDCQSIGVVFLNITPPTIVCVTLLLGERWSLAPAQCTSMREDPDMSNYLLQWKIKYKLGGKQIHSDIKRTLTHSHFNRGDYHNNIGLFEHTEKIFKKGYYVAPKNILVNDETLEKYEKQMAIVDWELNFSQKGDVSESIANPVRPMFFEKCAIYANPIIEKLRPYEFCVTFEQNGPIADHGAMLVMNSKIIGFFTWGDIRGRALSWWGSNRLPCFHDKLFSYFDQMLLKKINSEIPPGRRCNNHNKGEIIEFQSPDSYYFYNSRCPREFTSCSSVTKGEARFRLSRW